MSQKRMCQHLLDKIVRAGSFNNLCNVLEREEGVGMSGMPYKEKKAFFLQDLQSNPERYGSYYELCKFNIFTEAMTIHFIDGTKEKLDLYFKSFFEGTPEELKTFYEEYKPFMEEKERKVIAERIGGVER